MLKDILAFPKRFFLYILVGILTYLIFNIAIFFNGSFPTFYPITLFGWWISTVLTLKKVSPEHRTGEKWLISVTFFFTAFLLELLNYKFFIVKDALNELARPIVHLCTIATLIPIILYFIFSKCKLSFRLISSFSLMFISLAIDTYYLSNWNIEISEAIIQPITIIEILIVIVIPTLAETYIKSKSK